MGRQIRVTAVLLLGLLLLSSGVTWAVGPMFFSGDDSDSTGHCQGTACGGLLPKAMKAVYDASTSGGTGILAIMTNTSSIARTALNGWNNTANGGPGAAITYVSTATAIGAVNFSLYRMIYVPSASNLTTGGITSSQVSALNARKAAITAFVNSGGGVLALSERGLTGGFGWLPVSLTFATITDTNVQKTPDMAVELPATTATVNNTNLDHNHYHNSWGGTFGDLKVLATTQRTSGPNVPVIVGRITPVNRAPVVDDQTFGVAENSANGIGVGTIVATDPDAGQTRTFSVTGGTGQAAFAVSSAGVITVANSTLLNFETTPSFSLNITVSDNGTPQLSDTAVITINLTNANEPPVVSAATFSIAENSVNGTAVGTVSATDPDIGQTVSYSITAGNPSTAFAINPSTGQITVNNGAALNFETTPSFSLTVQALDTGTPTALSGTATITVNLTNVNEPPTDILLSNNTIAENAGGNSVVGTLSTTDVDALDTFTYTLVSGAGDTGNGSFNIDGSSLRATASLNFEATPSLSVRVRSTDAGGLWTEKAFIITVTNVTEPTVNLASGFNFPFGVAVDNGNVYIADRNNHVVWKINGATLTRVAGLALPPPPPLPGDEPVLPEGGYNGDGILATSAQLNGPTGVAVDASGTLFIADSGNNIIRKVASGTISTVAGVAAGAPLNYGVAVNGGSATAAKLWAPRGVAVDTAGNLYIADMMNQQVRKVDGFGTISAVAGVAGVTGNADGPVAIATLNSPLGVAVYTDLDNNTFVFIADEGNDRIRIVSGGEVDTVVVPGVVEAPSGVAVDGDGTLYIADTNNHRIVRVSGETYETVDVVAGTGTEGSGANQLNTPVGVAVKSDGCVLYIADLINNRIQKVDFCP